MPRRRITAELEPKAEINGKVWTAPSLCRGLLAAALRPTTLETKRSLLRSFLTHLRNRGNPYKARKIPYRFVIKFFAEELRISARPLPKLAWRTILDANPLVRQAARNKLCAITQVLLLNNLMKADNLYSPVMDMARGLLLATTRNSPPSKAPVIIDKHPLQMLPEACHRLATIWLMTGLRYCSLFSLPGKFQVCSWEPKPCARWETEAKTVTKSMPRIFCLCKFAEYKKICPICTNEKVKNKWTFDRANEILKGLKCQRHSFRRTLVTAFVVGSKLINNSPVSALYQVMVSQTFGWSCENKSMIQYYTSDKHAFTFSDLPEIVQIVVTLHDEIAPVLFARPLNEFHFNAYCKWSGRLSKLDRVCKARWVAGLVKTAKDMKLMKYLTNSANWGAAKYG